MATPLGTLACSSSRAAETPESEAGAAVDAGARALDSGADAPPDVAPSPMLDIGVVVGALDAGPDVGFPPLPPLTNVHALEREDSVGIDFDPVDDAVDYRVYALPDPSSVTVSTDGAITIDGGVYRCAGLRSTRGDDGLLGRQTRPTRDRAERSQSRYPEGRGWAQYPHDRAPSKYRSALSGVVPPGARKVNAASCRIPGDQSRPTPGPLAR